MGTSKHQLLRVAFVGPAGSGKTTMAKALASKHGGLVLSFATALKDEFAHEFGICRDQLDTVPDKYVYRTQMQEYGDMKRAENPNYWIDRLYLPPQVNIFIDDARFKNELAILKNFHVIELEGGPSTLTVAQAAHISENDWRGTGAPVVPWHPPESINERLEEIERILNGVS